VTRLHRQLAYVPGEVSLWPNLTGGEVIDLLGRLRGGLNPKRRATLLERFDLDPTKKCRAYSKGNRQKVALIAALAVVWSARLGTHLFIRVMGHHPVEDGRYQQLRKDWAGNFVRKMFGFFQMQAASVVLLGVAFLVVCLNPAPVLHPLEWAGAGLWLVAISGEALAEALKLARVLSALPQACLRNDRLSMLESLDLSEDEAMRNEVRHGQRTLASGETLEGARRFSGGAGRHGT